MYYINTFKGVDKMKALLHFLIFAVLTVIMCSIAIVLGYETYYHVSDPTQFNYKAVALYFVLWVASGYAFFRK